MSSVSKIHSNDGTHTLTSPPPPRNTESLVGFFLSCIFTVDHLREPLNSGGMISSPVASTGGDAAAFRGLVTPAGLFDKPPVDFLATKPGANNINMDMDINMDKIKMHEYTVL